MGRRILLKSETGVQPVSLKQKKKKNMYGKYVCKKVTGLDGESKMIGEV
jgi:hypothetical protein